LTRRYELLACSFAVCLVATQVAIKPRPGGTSARAATDFARRMREWRSRVAPAVDLTLRDGSTFRLADQIGRRVVILNFFTTWSDACVRELPDLQRYVQRLQDEGKPVVAVAIDGQERSQLVDRFSEMLNLTLPTGIDESGTVARAYEVGGFPTTVVIGADGRVLLYQLDEITNPEVAFDATLGREFGVLERAGRMRAR